MTELLKVVALHASYGTVPVLTDVSVDVAQSSVIGLVGPNGHGKTTLLRSISGMMPRLSGEIFLSGQAIVRSKPERIARAGIVHVPQGDLVYKDMTILENLLVGGYLNASAAVSNRQLEHVFCLFPRLAERRTQSASTLSGGERRMLGIGRGLMMADAKLLLLDEPSLGLAPVIIEQIYAAIGVLSASGLTIVVVEENLGRAMSVSDEIYLIERGTLAWKGTALEAKNNDRILEAYFGTHV
jgi:branched-chain amino acid transport system ATP-binding protein